MRFALVVVAVLVSLFAAGAQAGEERYDYDALGRLVRVIDEQGRVTEYVYDAAGNILQVIVSGAGSAQPPVVTASTPASIRRGETRTVEITGSGLANAHVGTTDPNLDISGLQVSATQITFSLTAALTATLGARPITLSSASGTTSAQITVNPVLPRLNMSPLPIAVPPTGTGRNFFVTLSSPDNIEHVVTLQSSNPARMTVSPATVTFAPGQIERIVTVSGHSVGNAAVNLSSPLLASNSVPVFVTAEFSGITTSFAPLLQVIKQAAPGGSSTSFGPFVAPLVGVARGAYMDGVAPNRFNVGSGPTDLVISGNDLGGVTGVSITPSAGLTLGAISVAADGRSVTVPLTVAPGAALTPRKVTLQGANQPYLAARPGADQILITLPPPHVDSLDPIFAVVGTTAMTVTVRGRNLQSPERVTITPPNGISISSPPAASADGTSLTVQVSVSPNAATGPRLLTVTTVGGTSDTGATAANTFSVVNEAVSVNTPIIAPLVGVLKAEPPPAPTLNAYASLVGVVVPPAATSINPAVGIVGETVNLTVNGFGLHNVTALQLFPADGVTVGPLGAGPDGLTLSTQLTIAPSASQQLREVRLSAGAVPVVFTNAAAALFRVSAPHAVFDSITPIVLQAGAPAVTITLTGRNFQNASQLRLEPATGITVTNLAVNGTGTQATATISAAAGAALGPRALVLTTPAGDSPLELSAFNTVTVVNAIQGNVSPVISGPLGVVLEGNAPPATLSVGPIVAPALGVVLDTAPPAPPQETVRATIVGVAVGPFASGVQVPPLTPTSSGTLVVSGVGLADVTAIQVVPAAGVAVGALTIAPDGTQVSAPLTLSGAAAGVRGVQVMRGANRVEFIPAGMKTFRIGVGVPDIDSLTPILESRNRVFNLLIRGQNLQDAYEVRAEPAAGLQFDSVLTPNGAGTELTVRVFIAPDAPLGARVIRVFTPGGATTDAAEPANTFTVLE